MQVLAFAASAAGAPLVPFCIDRRPVGPQDVLIDILYCGVCHFDAERACKEGARFPMVPGHEIVGRVAEVGFRVSRFRVGQMAAVGWTVDACGKCEACRDDHEYFCEQDAAQAFDSTEMDRATPTYGGYSTQIVVAEPFVFKLAADVDAAGTAPLLCSGETIYGVLRGCRVMPGDRVGVIGRGGNAQLAVKLASSMGAEVTLLATPATEPGAQMSEARGLSFLGDPRFSQELAGRLDVLLDALVAPATADAADAAPAFRLLRPGGEFFFLEDSSETVPFTAFSVGQPGVSISVCGGMNRTQEMLDFCARHGIVCDVEVISSRELNQAHERLRRDPGLRLVLDVATLRDV